MSRARRTCTTAAEKIKLMQFQKQRAASVAAAGCGIRSPAKAPLRLWAREQAVELSRLVLGFARLSRRLPDASDRSFWQLCHKRFQGVFTCKQMQAKVRYLHLRFRKLAEGAAKTLHLAERDSVQIWTEIMHNTASRSPSSSTRPDRPRSTSSASTRSRSSSPPSPASYNRRTGAYTHQDAAGRWGAQFDDHAQHDRVGAAGMAKDKAFESWFGNASTGPTSIKEAWCTNKAFHQNVSGMTGIFPNGKSTGSGAKGPDAAEAELAQEGSACSTQMHENAHECKNPEPEGDAADAADATTSIARKNALLLHHVTVADLAAAVKILAEVIARPPGVV
ncbi:hypothetical protein L7F22_028592 [Adiantum nelumboides]|nr:hypothetical protein [Adiantum nelumboides]